MTRHSDAVSVLTDARFVPVAGEHADQHSSSLQAARLLAPRAELGVTELLPQAVDSLTAQRPIDLLGDVLTPWCFQLACRTLGVKEEPVLLDLAKRVFLAAAFPYKENVNETATPATAELARRLNTDNRIGVQAFVALATSLPHFVAGCWVLLLSNPVQLQRLQTNASLQYSAIEECLRLCGPSAIQFRRALSDAEVGGVQVRKGETLLVVIYTANRDPAVFANPETFDIGRSPNPHLTFGRSTHACAGAEIVRWIARTLMLALAPQLALFEVTESPVWEGMAIRFLPRLAVSRRGT